jgi:primosomal protein N'
MTTTPVSPLHERQVENLDAAHQIDPVGYLEQTLNRRELTLPPQARIHRLRALTRRRARVRVRVEHDVTTSRHDHAAEWSQ